VEQRENPYDPDTLPVGVLGKPHGLAGEMILRPFNAASACEWLEGGAPGSLLLERDGRRASHRLRSCRPAGDRLLVAFEGVTTPEAARALTLSVVRIPRSALPPLGPREYYVEDVVGCEVINADGTRLGTVDQTFWNGAQDVMVVVPGDKGEADELLIPLVPDFVQMVDAPARRITVTWDAAQNG
jgi:16S rRNA processing protein RimM